jgi:predicted RNase H-related nuclease YkuK (DUF458 family)
MQFKNYKRQNVDLIQHCLEQRIKHGSDLKIHIGTDSSAAHGFVYYYTVVAFRYGKQGVHFIFVKEKVQSYRTESGKPDLFTKLLRECQLTIDVALKLTQEQIIPKEMIMLEFDYNNLVDTVSNRLVSAAKGWALGYDFKYMVKYKENAHRPDQWEDQIACKAANHLCQGV